MSRFESFAALSTVFGACLNLLACAAAQYEHCLQTGKTLFGSNESPEQSMKMSSTHLEEQPACTILQEGI